VVDNSESSLVHLASAHPPDTAPGPRCPWMLIVTDAAPAGEDGTGFGPVFGPLPRIVSVRNVRSIATAPGARYALIVVALALFALLSMHGWGIHAGAHADGGHRPIQIVAAHADAHGEPSAAGSDPVHQAADGAAAGQNCRGACGDGAPGSGTGVLGLCLAVLGGLILGLALLLLCGGVRVLRATMPTWRHPVLLGRDRDPPDLLRLCVVRC
jgi:hypothetical protein